VLAAFGPGWAARAGIVVAVAAAVVACTAAWRELSQARRLHASEMLAASKAHGSALAAERKHNAGVVETLTDRARHAAAEIVRHQATIDQLNRDTGKLRGEISTLHGDNSFLRVEVQRCETAITSLRETIRVREAELSALRNDADGQVRGIPRRVMADDDCASEQDADADDLWTDGTYPTLTELSRIDAIVLPNYEGERRFA
jgi:chromosome segregation ATPase